MKKLISVFLCFAMLFSCMPQLILASDDSYDVSAEAAVLYDLGVTDFEKASDVGVSRAAFTRYAMKLADIPVAPHAGTVFDDITASHPDYDYVMSAVDFGLISRGTSYRPDDNVSLTEAAKIMIMLLGYDYMAEARGGYPQGYLQTARDIDLLDGITITEGALSQATACIILCNALHVRLPEITYTDEGATQFKTGTATILGQYRNMSFVTGNVDGTPFYAIADESGLGEGRMSIDGIVYNSGSINTRDLFGCNVDAYIDNETNTVVSCYTTDANRILSIYAEDVISYSGRVFTYEDAHGNEKSIAMASNAYVFYNGKIFDFDSSKAVPESGSITFVSQSSGSATTVYIKSYMTTVVDRISTSDYIIVDKYSKDNNLMLDPQKVEYTIVTEMGISIDFKAIKAGDVLCSAVSADGGVAEVVCVSDEFMGTYSGNGDGYIQIDGTSYRLSAALEGKVDDIITLGKDATFRLDIEQRVADIIPAGVAGEEVGYLFWGRYRANGFDTDLYARILKLDGSKSMYEFADVFSINGLGYKDAVVAYNAHKSPDYDSLLCAVVKFRIDEEGRIKSLTYSDKAGGDGGLYVTQTVEEADEYHTYQQWFNNVGVDIICDTDLKIFKVPNPLYSVDSIDEDNYSVEAPETISENNSTLGYMLEGYTTVADDGLSKYLLMQKIEDDFSAGSVDLSDSYPYMVNSVKKMYRNGEPCEALELCGMFYSTDNPYVIYSYGESDFTDAGVSGGDIIRFKVTENNVIKGSKAFDIIYKNGAKEFVDGSYTVQAGGSRITISRAKFAYIYEFRKDVAGAADITDSPESLTTGAGSPIYMPNVTIFKYDNKQKRIVELSVGDIKDYKSFGDDKTTVIYWRVYYQVPVMFVVGE